MEARFELLCALPLRARGHHSLSRRLGDASQPDATRASLWRSLGADCTIHQVCTIGAGPRASGATIGDHVIIGWHLSTGAVTIGDGATIAPNSPVIPDVPAGATATGVPARILPATASMKTLVHAARCCMQLEIDLTIFSRGGGLPTL